MTQAEKLRRLKERAKRLAIQLLLIEDALEDWHEDLADFLTLIVNMEEFLEENGNLAQKGRDHG